MDLLAEWYPGLGEVETIRRMSPLVREFVSDAVAEDEDFLKGYLLPVLERPDPEEAILDDLRDAICGLEFEDAGLGGDLGNLGKSILKRVKKAVRRVHEKVKKTIVPKQIRKIEEKAHKAITRAGEKVRKSGKKIWKKYGNIIIGVVGLVLAPFTGGASLAAASALTAANTAYMKKRAADQARKAAKANAGQLADEAQRQQDAAEQQLNAFYSQNQQWFVDNLDLTPDKWSQLTFEQKVDILKNGLQGRPPSDVAPMPEPAAPAPSGGGYAAPSGGGGGGGGGPYPEAAIQSGAAPSAGPSERQVAAAGMFDSSMLPLLASGLVLALVFGKPTKGRRTRKNPRRSYRKAA